ncbi:MAG: pyridoxamine 5'-phosphate oxidase family protein [Chloroflexi bacterium]|nr:pyridoxamine 5'-phosphate oxidase family protein [Chloroflexota bacterium]
MRLAALSPKGRPNIRCLWFVCRQGRIYMWMQESTPPGRSISVHPDVVMLFDGEREPRSGRILRVRGRAAYPREMSIVWRVLMGLARKYFLTRPGLGNLLAHARTVPVAVRFYTKGWGDQGLAKGLKGVIVEVVPESFEWLPRSLAKAA